MAVNLNAQGDCTTNYLGSGQGSCDITKFGDLKGFVPFDKSVSYDITNGVEAFGLTEYTNTVKGLLAFPYVTDLQDFTQDTPENEKNTSSIGVLTEIRAGKPQFSLMYKGGSCQTKSLFNKRGDGKWNYALVFEAGILMATNVAGDKLVPFDGGMLSVETMKIQQGTDPQMTTATIQLLDAVEFNERHVFIPFSKAGDLDDVKGAIETIVTVDPIEDGDTTFTFSVKSACNTDVVTLGLDDTDLWVLGGTQASATNISDVSYNATTGKYTGTVDSAFAENDTVKPTLSDGTYIVVEDATGNLYKGTSALVTVDAAASV